jgi:hypothetical protein
MNTMQIQLQLQQIWMHVYDYTVFASSVTLGSNSTSFNVSEILFIINYWKRQIDTSVKLISEFIVPKEETVTELKI